VLAVIAFDFDPTVRIGGLLVRWETLGIAGALFLALLAAGLLAARSPRRDGSTHDQDLRPDDLLFIALAAVPGALIGARVGYALVHLDYYGARLGDLLDPALGGLQLSLGITGGIISALVVARSLGLPVGRWAHIAALPILVAIEGGKLAMAWGGAGQGRPAVSDLSTAYLGAGPWGSLAPALPSIPSQILEGLGTGVIALVIALVLAAGALRTRDGRLLLVAGAVWLGFRFAVASTWRDPAVVGDALNADQVISLLLLVIDLVLLAALVLPSRRRRSAASEAGEERADWPSEDVAGSWRDRPV
jgi:prolipoprotein diacylglyceryltransferase